MKNHTTMKKIIMMCMVLLAISSCKKGNDYVPLSEEDAAAIPYQMGQTVKFINQDNDTVVCQVTWDQTHLSDPQLRKRDFGFWLTRSLLLHPNRGVDLRDLPIPYQFHHLPRKRDVFQLEQRTCH